MLTTNRNSQNNTMITSQWKTWKYIPSLILSPVHNRSTVCCSQVNSVQDTAWSISVTEEHQHVSRASGTTKSWLYTEKNCVHAYISTADSGLRPANERRRYGVTTSLIGWAQA